MTPDWFDQTPYPCRLEWGRRGAREAAARGDILVVVDTLRFSTAAAAAVHHGALVYPCAGEEEAARLAERLGISVPRGEGRRRALSPGQYQEVAPGTPVLLVSPNGATCCRYGRGAPALFVGALVNARAAAAAAAQTAAATGAPVTVIACGERWEDCGEDGPLRPAVEDTLGAGAILASLPGARSPEACVCAAAFLQTQARLEELLWECGSGRELRAKGLGDDVRFAASLDRYDTVPALHGESLEGWLIVDG